MQRPRRTAACETQSTGALRQAKKSRLLHPQRRSSNRGSSLTRCSSTERLSLLGGIAANQNTQSSSQRSRSISNVRTPQRTPTCMTPTKVSQFTGEKHRAAVTDKRWIQEQVVKITDYLKTIDCGVNNDFLYKGGLKTMSIKQFIGLVNYFLKFIAGNKFTVGSNHVESISKILNLIDYPYTVNKSWLKTPTAPHAFGNVVMLFAYFMEFIPPADNEVSFKKKYLVISDEFPDTDFALKLFTMAEEGFALWNNQKNEEFEKLQKAALDELIRKKVSVASSDALDEEIRGLNVELDRVISKKAVIKDEDEYFRLDKEVKTNQRKIAKLQNIHQENQKILKKLESQVNAQLAQIAIMESRLDEIRKVVENQEVSIGKRNQLIEEVGQMKSILKTKTQSVCDMQEVDQQRQVLLSRHLKQMTEKVAQFNSYIRKIMSEFEDIDVDIEKLCLYQNSDMEIQEQIKENVVFLRRLQGHIANRIEKLSKQSESFKTQTKLISFEISECIEPKTKKMMEEIKEHQRNVDELEREIIAVKNYTRDQVHELTLKASKANGFIDALKKTIEVNRKTVNKARKENEAMMALVKERFEQSLTIRDSQLKCFREALDVLDKNCADAKALMQ